MIPIHVHGQTHNCWNDGQCDGFTSVPTEFIQKVHCQAFKKAGKTPVEKFAEDEIGYILKKKI